MLRHPEAPGLDLYSVGPNGIDEDGQGDDVVPTPSELAAGGRLAAAPKGLVALAVLLGWCALGPYTRKGRSDSLATECGRALVLASLATFAVMGIVLWLVLGVERLDLAGLRSLFFVPPQLALVAGDGLLCFFLALAWRLSRPLEDRPPTSHEAGTLDRAQDG